MSLKEPAADTASSLWRHRNFILFWSSQTVSVIGTRISGITIPFLATTTLRASTFQVSLITVLTWLPFLLFSLSAGVLVDRTRKRRLMIWCDVLRALLMGAVPVIALMGWLTLWQVYLAVGVVGVLTVFFNIAYQSQLPDLIESSQLVDGNGKLQLSQSLAELAGPAAGGALITVVGALRAVTADALSFVFSGVALWLVREAEPQRHPEPQDEPDGFRASAVEGLRFVVGHPIMRSLLACSSTANFFSMAITSIEIVYLVENLRASSWAMGLVLTVGTVGGITTGLLARRITERIGSARVIWVSMLVPGPLYLLIPLSRPGWGVLLYAIGLAAFSANAVLYNVAETSYRQAVCPPEMLGRMNASVLWIAHGVIPLGALFGGVLATWVGLRATLWICALGMWAASLCVLCSPLRKLRDVPAT